MLSAFLITIAATMAFVYGDEYLLAPQWLRVTIQLVVAVVLFAAVAADWSRR